MYWSLDFFRGIDQLDNLHFVSALVLRSHYIQISTRSMRYFVEPLTDIESWLSF